MKPLQVIVWAFTWWFTLLHGGLFAKWLQLFSSLYLCTFATMTVFPPHQEVELVSLPLDLSWFCDLLWLRECGGSDSVTD